MLSTEDDIAMVAEAADGAEAITRAEESAPDVILASWCGKKVRAATIEGRPGWADVPAVATGHIYEIKSTYILQPGPASLTEGVRQVHHVLCRVAGVPPDPALTPSQTPSPSRARR